MNSSQADTGRRDPIPPYLRTLLEEVAQEAARAVTDALLGVNPEQHSPPAGSQRRPALITVTATDQVNYVLRPNDRRLRAFLADQRNQYRP